MGDSNAVGTLYMSVTELFEVIDTVPPYYQLMRKSKVLLQEQLN
jgi:hypothetical protein